MSRMRDPLAAEALMKEAGVEPLTEYPGVLKPWSCRCLRCARIVSPMLASILKGQGGCRYCGNEQSALTRRFNADQAVQIALDHGFEPLEPYAGRKASWRMMCCSCGREVTPTFGSIQDGHGCAYCAQRRVDPKDAVQRMRSACLEPLEPYPGSAEPWLCRCTRCGNDVSPSYNSIQRGQGGCLPCGISQTALALRNDPDKVAQTMRDHGLEPLVAYPGANVQWLCRCEACGHDVVPRYSGILNGQGGCRYCQRGGYDPGQPGYLYLIHHPLGAWKVGISNHPKARITCHRRRGYEKEASVLWGPMEGSEAYRVEQELIASWRGAAWPMGLPSNIAGYTETIPDNVTERGALVNSIEALLPMGCVK